MSSQSKFLLHQSHMARMVGDKRAISIPDRSPGGTVASAAAVRLEAWRLMQTSTNKTFLRDRSNESKWKKPSSIAKEGTDATPASAVPDAAIGLAAAAGP